MRFVSGVSSGGSTRRVFDFNERVLWCKLSFTGAVELLGRGVDTTEAEGINFADNDEIELDFRTGGDGCPPNNFYASGAGDVEWIAIIR